jgi:hypothetical protein
LVTPDTGKLVEWLFFKTVMCDGCLYSGWHFAGEGTIRGVVIVDGWGSSNSHGFQFSNGKFITLIAPRAFNNRYVGIVIDGAEHVEIIAPQVTGNSRVGYGTSPGIYISTSNNKIIGGYSKEGVFPGWPAYQSYGIFIANAVTNVIIEGVDLRNNVAGAIGNLGNLGSGSIVRGCLGFDTENFKVTSLSVSVGRGGVYGSASVITSPSGVITYPRIKITWSGTFGSGETVTVKVEAVYTDNSTAYIEKSATTTGSLWLTDDDIIALISQGKNITKLNIYAKTNLSSTSVTVTVDAYGKG